ncbi:iron transporter [Acidobacteria bacterium Mor1]|nr:iron transporter [Acidobacteria bacterium Mor1]
MSDSSAKKGSILTLLGPGILVAATGVGAGDLINASIGGSELGLTVLWAAWVGALLKWFLNEGIARWQIATETTLLEGWVQKLGRWIQWVFLLYLVAWTFFTGGALVSACGVAGTGLFPLSSDLGNSKILWGILHSLVGAALVLLGGFKLFERMMAFFIAMMFVAVVFTAAMSSPDWGAMASGLLIPRIPGGDIAWVLGLLGGVGGTVTLMSYGYWIREKGRRGAEGMRTCRLDLTVGYTMTAIFGISMIVIGSKVDLQKGPTVALELAGQLEAVMGPAGKWVFLVGFWGAVFSSLLGVWQSIPYLFADFLLLTRGAANAPGSVNADLDATPAYKGYLAFIALAPLPLLWISLKSAQKIYAVMGSFFMPLLALTLLLLNNRRGFVGDEFRNRWASNLALVGTLGLFGYLAAVKALGL